MSPREAHRPASEWLPSRPRKSAAGTRRHHMKRLTWRIRQHLPGATRVLVTPAEQVGDPERPDIRYVLVAYDADGNRIKTAPGASSKVAALLQGAYPTADWRRPQTWHADTNRLATWPADTRQAA